MSSSVASRILTAAFASCLACPNVFLPVSTTKRLVVAVVQITRLFMLCSGSDNLFQACLPADMIPFAYPFLLSHPADRAIIARQKLYVPTLWPDVVKRKSSGFAFERNLVGRLLPLPIDHRYEFTHMIEAARRS